MIIERTEEFKINKQQHQQIAALLQRSFANYPWNRSFYNQLPSFRYLVKGDDNILIGHMGVCHRLMNLDGESIRVFGVMDLCVEQAYQSQRIASRMLESLTTLGQQHGVEFIVLIAQEHQLYENNGFVLYDHACKWLVINQQKSLGICLRRLEDCLMVKGLGDRAWNGQIADFLGPIF